MITVALPRGDSLNKNLAVLEKAGADISVIDENSVVVSDNKGEFSYIICDENDIASFVELGIADVGICDKALLLENTKKVKELLDLKIGADKLCIIGAREKKTVTNETLNVATRYPNIAEKVFQMRQIKIKPMILGSGTELAFLWGYADLIVCKMQEVKLLNPETIAIYEFVGNTSYRLIGNNLSLNLKSSEIYAFVDKLRGVC